MGFWIARDKDGDLYLYNYRPRRFRTCFGNLPDNTDYRAFRLDRGLYHGVTWENSPKECKITVCRDKKQ